MTNSHQIENITAFQLKELLDQPLPPLVLDVREAQELEICSLPTCVHIPLAHLSQALDKISDERVIVTLCHHGYRSLQAALFLKSHGFKNIFNLKGGIHAWSELIDPSMNRY
ncbi:MAG: sulfurtransferase [Alphaproteobacteria bacterium]|nr:sulfurtransferase [Alphaproteobacteria bacterium]